MSIIKRGKCSSKMIVSESVYNCPDCGHVEMLSDSDKDSDQDTEKMCPHCKILMTLMSSSSHLEEKDEKSEE